MRTSLLLLRWLIGAMGALVLLALATIGGAIWLTLPRGDLDAHIPGLSLSLIHI